MNINYENNLNDQQLQAVQHKEGPGLIIAGPGSGKTHTMTYRTAYLIEHGVQPWQILLLTFTKKAAKEMLGRVVNLIGPKANNVQGGTFHSFAAQLLFKHYDRLGYTEQISILGTSDQTELVGVLRKDMQERYQANGGMGLNASSRLPVSSKFVHLFSTAANKQKNIQDIFQDFPAFEDFQDIAVDMYYQYHAAKKEMNLLDYDDLLIELRRLLTESQFLRKMYGQKFWYIIIDEYQDTNLIQKDIATLLASEHRNIVVVGDDCQSIYGFRGANIQNILGFKADFPEAKTYKLTKNYRSYPGIVDVANALIKKAEEKLEKELIAVSQNSQVVPRLKPYPDQMAQAEGVVREIQQYHRAGTPYKDIAVLYRNGYHANLIDMFLTSQNIPYVKIGGVKLTESAHVKDLLSFLAVRVNPKDRLNWKRLLTLFPGVGPKSANTVLHEIERYVCAEQKSLADEMAIGLSLLSGKQKYKTALRALGKFLLTIQEPTGQKFQTVKDVLDTVWEYYQPIFNAKFDKGEREHRQFGIDHVLSYSENFQSLTAFMAEFVLSEEQDTTKKGDVLTLSTIHSAKGCEWAAVIIIECIEGALPSYRAENIEEELRLLYVAATRAKQHLTITYPEHIRVYGENEPSEPSRFLEGLPHVGVE